ncbi:unnamed protein product [Dovyalis caffra]|uniref:Beta-galactosidase n=1 Tax=Dovyalis caffra TaxID=77055 RepID=A0AAV1S353_9ROSI|nr:unnamed protein product [Dovyalis caffra]
MRRVLHIVAAVLAVISSSSIVHGRDVTYDGRSLIIDGQRKILFSGSIHYPRSTPEMWPSLIAKAKEGGLDAVQTYVFWNVHEPQPGQYDFSGGHDIVRFIKEVQAQGLYACLRIGPFIQSEWSYGGLPFWLHDIPGIVFRSDNEPFKVHMQNFTAKIVSMMQSEKLYASQGGPIILSQIENEYGTVEKTYGEKGLAYVHWAGQMAVGLQTGVPWFMCKQNDAPDPVKKEETLIECNLQINSCNGMKCGETFVGPNSPNKPSIWTENWTTHFPAEKNFSELIGKSCVSLSYQVYGEDAPMRSAEDIAFHVTLFIAAKKGSFVNYYMYHGGTNFGRTAAAFVTTSYYDQAPLDEYGLTSQPKWGHLKELHAALKLCLTPLLSGVQAHLYLGPQQQAYIFSAPTGECAAFLINNDTTNAASVPFRNSSYDLPPRSISILPDCKNVAFNTAKARLICLPCYEIQEPFVSTQYSTRTMGRGKVLDAADMWQEFTEAIPNFKSTSTKSETLLEQMNTTKDSSDYLWYTFSLVFDFSCNKHTLHETSDPQAILDVSSFGHVLHAFVNGQAVGSAQGSHENPRFKFERTVSLSIGINNVSLLSVMVGMPDSGAYLETRGSGLRSVMIRDKQDNKDFTNYPWGYQLGLQGEKLQIYTEQGSSQVQWKKFSNAGNPLTWYKTLVDAPPGDVPVALNLASMGKGEAWVNGQSIGRYWPSYHAPGGSSQTWYNVPRSFLKPTGNLLVLLEEEGGNPSKYPWTLPQSHKCAVM